MVVSRQIDKSRVQPQSGAGIFWLRQCFQGEVNGMVSSLQPITLELMLAFRRVTVSEHLTTAAPFVRKYRIALVDTGLI